MTDNGNGIIGISPILTSAGDDVSQFHYITSFSGGFSEAACENIVAFKRADASSPEIVNAVISGKVFNSMTVNFHGNDLNTGETVLEFKMTLHNAVIRNLGVNLENRLSQNQVDLSLFEQLTITSESISVMDSSGAMTVATCEKVK